MKCAQMPWTVIYSSVFEEWLESCSESLQNEALAHIELLSMMGVKLPFPHSSKIRGTKLPGMRKLRFKHGKSEIRILYIFDPLRQVFLLAGGDKLSSKKWYEKNVPFAEGIFREYLESLKDGGGDMK